MLSESSYLYNPSYLGHDAKDAKWMNIVTENVRKDWRPVVNAIRVRNNKSILLSNYKLDSVRKYFETNDIEFCNDTKFEPLPVWHKILETIVEEMMKNPPKAEINALDPTAIDEKEKDIFRLKNRKAHEDNINKSRIALGLAPEKYGNENFKSNVKDFDGNNMDANDDEMINLFSTLLQRMNYEIDCQALLNTIVKLQRFDKETIRRLVLDILSVKTVCLDTYVDRMTGEIKTTYIYPEEAYSIAGDAEDCNDDIAKGYERSVTVRDWLGMVGDDFNFERDWCNLIYALNFSNNWKYTGFVRDGVRYDSWGNGELSKKAGIDGNDDITTSKLCDFSLAYTYRVFVGKLQVPTIEKIGKYVENAGAMVRDEKVYEDFLKNKKQTEGYNVSCVYQEQIYESYYLATSQTTQWIYRWGKMYYTQLQGAYDQYAKGSMIFYRLEGKSPVELCMPYLEIAHLAYYRFKWLIYHAKPQKEIHYIEEIDQLAEMWGKIYPQSDSNKIGNQNVIKEIIDYKRKNFIDLRTFPVIDGKPYPMMLPEAGSKMGLDRLALEMQSVFSWAENKIRDDIGMTDLRLGEVDNPREGYKQGMEKRQSSFNTTGFIYRMIQFPKELMCQSILNYIQDIISYPDSMAYKWLVKIAGEANIKSIAQLKNIAPHRYGIFVEDVNSSYDKQKIEQIINGALQTKEIEQSTWNTLTLILNQDYKKAMKLLAIAKAQEKKKAQQFQMQMQQQKAQQDQQLEKMRQQTEQIKGQLAIEKEKIIAQGQIQVAQLNNDAKKEVKQMGIDSEPSKQEVRNEAKKDAMTHKSDLDEQKAFGS